MTTNRLRHATPIARRIVRADAAREALAICVTAERMAAEAAAALEVDDERLFALLEQRERMLGELAMHIVALKLERPTADNRLLAASERAMDEADALVARVCDALSATHRTTLSLAVRVADKVSELRTELARVQRAGSAMTGYAPAGTVSTVDRVR